MATYLLNPRFMTNGNFNAFGKKPLDFKVPMPQIKIQIKYVFDGGQTNRKQLKFIQIEIRCLNVKKTKDSILSDCRHRRNTRHI